MEGTLWSFATVLGPIVLILVIGYALFKRRRLTPKEQEVQARKIDQLYEDTPAQHHQAEVEAEAEEQRIKARSGVS